MDSPPESSSRRAAVILTAYAANGQLHHPKTGAVRLRWGRHLVVQVLRRVDLDRAAALSRLLFRLWRRGRFLYSRSLSSCRFHSGT